MKAETLMVLLNFSPERVKRNHPFWKKLFETGINIEQRNIKFKRWKGKFEYLKNNWRFHKNIIIDFYSYLKLNFPNPIPYPLFFYCKNEYNRNTDYNYYREEKLDNFAKNKIKHLDDKRTGELQCIEYNDDFYYEYDDFYYEYDDYYGNYYDYYYDIIERDETIEYLADKWLKDILSGESFYEKNKDYFTKTEVKHFLTCDWVESDIKRVSQSSSMDLLQYYWKIKTRANGLNLPSYFFVDKFIGHPGDPKAMNYFKFICANKRSIRNINEIYDITDFVFRGVFLGNFNNMTWQELRRLSDEWHAELERQALLGIPDKPREEQLNKKWNKKTVIKDFSLTVDEEIWTINEITSAKLLYEEGKGMHNCVFNYLDNCISGRCAIFSLKINDKRLATLEISINNSELRLVQAQEGMNAPVKNEEIQKIILIWSKENNINIQEDFFLDNIIEDEDDGYERRLDNNVVIADNDNLLDNLEDEYYSRLYNIDIENDESTEKK